LESAYAEIFVTKERLQFFNSIKGSFRGQKRRAFNQFAAFQRATDELRRLKESDLPHVIPLVEELITSDEVDASSAILAYRLLRTASSMGDRRAKQWYNRYLDRLRAHGFWLEVAFSKSGHSHQSENTFFSPYPYHSPSLDERIEDAGLRTLLDRGENYKHLRRTLELVHRHPSLAFEMTSERKPKPRQEALTREDHQRFSAYTDLLFGRNGMLFDGVAEAHFEASENAEAHALPTDLNLNADIEDRDNFFGDAQYFQTGYVSYMAYNIEQARAIHPSFHQYLQDWFASTEKKNERFIYFCRVDNGPGIARHFERFGCEDSGSPRTLKEVISNRATSRSDPGAGDGLRIMTEVVTELSGCLIIASGPEYFHFHGLKAANSEKPDEYGQGEVERGTIVFLAVPEKR